MSLPAISPKEAAVKIKNGAILIDIREAEEVRREAITGALHHALSGFDKPLNIDYPEIIYTCKSGMRTKQNASLLAKNSMSPAFILEGGLNGWKSAGFAVLSDKKQPIELGRQVQITAGGIGLIGAILSLTLSPLYALIPAFIGAGLVFSGVTGTCGMARMLNLMPWNKK